MRIVLEKDFLELVNSENGKKLSKEIATRWKKELTEDKFNVQLIKSQKVLKIIKEEQHSFQVLKICVALYQPITI